MTAFDAVPPRPIRLPATAPPMLQVVVDTEEEFDWGADFDRTATGVSHLQEIWRFQELCEAFGVKPTYVVDYPIAIQKESETTLKPLVAEGRALVGAHLQPWVNPPFDEEINRFNSYPGNLPPALEHRKLDLLVEAIEKRFGVRPFIYKAGRYGLGPATPETLMAFGIKIDLSVCPGFDFGEDGGPDFSSGTSDPYWFDNDRRLLELPVTGGFTGYLRRSGPTIHRLALRGGGRHVRVNAVLARIGALARIRLSPEGFGFEDTRALTEALLGDGVRIFSMTLHSPSLWPGHTPYVRSEADLSGFLRHIRQYFEYFLRELGGVVTTPSDVRTLLLQQPPEVGG